MSTEQKLQLLIQQYGILLRVYETFKNLYVEQPKRVELMNELSGSFFILVRDSLLANVVMSISRMSDPAEFKGNENVTLRSLAEQTVSSDWPSHEDRDTYLEKLRILKEIKGSITKLRDKQIAHADLSSMLGEKNYNFPKIKHLEKTLGVIGDALGVAHRSFFNSELSPEVVRNLKNELTVLDLARVGLAVKSEEIESSLSGEIREDYPKRSVLATPDWLKS